MTKAVFTYSPSGGYDDQPEWRYHFPKTYLNQVAAAVGDWIVYYEPRRTEGPFSSTGRQAHFAVTHLDRVDADPDPSRPDHSYAYVSQYLEFDSPVPFRDGVRSYESALTKPDGTTNKGAFGRSVRIVPDLEFAAIVVKGFAQTPSPWDLPNAVEHLVPESVERPLITQLVQRPFRDAAFRKNVRRAYDNTCAVTGLKLLNGGGRPEVQAAHIRAVADNGPDAVRNGIALTGTFHWLFDRGLMSFDDSYRISISSKGVPVEVARMVRPGGVLNVPADREYRPHPTYLRWHRENRFKPSRGGGVGEELRKLDR